MVFECQGCNDNCKSSWPTCPTGCTYEDVDIPKDAKIWNPVGDEFSALKENAKKVALELDTITKAG